MVCWDCAVAGISVSVELAQGEQPGLQPFPVAKLSGRSLNRGTGDPFEVAEHAAWMVVSSWTLMSPDASFEVGHWVVAESVVGLEKRKVEEEQST